MYAFTHIANDGNLLPAPLTNQFSVRIAPAERADIVVNFASFPVGTTLYLVNQLQQVDTRRPASVQAPGTRVLKIIVDRNPPASAPNPPAPPSRAASAARPCPLPRNSLRCRFVSGSSIAASGIWRVNGQVFNVLAPRATVTKGSTEIWEFTNLDNGWQHPIHIHFEEVRILSKTVNGVNVPVPVHERGRKDVVVLGERMTVRVLVRFRDFTGKYMMHCHNLTHEDHAMMVRFDIV